MKVIKFNLKELEKQDTGFSYYILGRSYDLEENGEQQDFAKALYYYQKGCVIDNPFCIYSLGISYKLGLGDLLENNEEKANELLNNAYPKIINLINNKNTSNIEKINDIAGIRIVCTLKDDIFFIRDLVKQIPDIHVLKEKDYVTNPKESGYSSYHMIVEVPVKLTQKTIYVKCEIQIRTLAMDFWASFEHKVKYKTKNDVNPKMSKELVSCAKMINKFDTKMINYK